MLLVLQQSAQLPSFCCSSSPDSALKSCASEASAVKHVGRRFAAEAGSVTFTLRLLLGRMAIPSFHSRTWTMLQGPPTCAVSVGGAASLPLPPLAGSPTATAGVTSIWWWPEAGADRKTRSQPHRPSPQTCVFDFVVWLLPTTDFKNTFK